jgi:hypothetical protein
LLLRNGNLEKLDRRLKGEYQEEYKRVKQNGYSCHNRFKNFCVYENANSKINIFLLGDSMIAVLLKDFINKTINSEYKLIHISYSNNFYLPDSIQVKKSSGEIIQNETVHIKTKEMLSDPYYNNSFIVFFTNYENYFFSSKLVIKNNVKKIIDSKKYFSYSFLKEKKFDQNETFNLLSRELKKNFLELAKTKYIIIVYPIPSPGKNIPRQVNKLNKGKEINHDELNINYSFFIERNKKIFESLDSIQHPKIFRIYPHEIICDKTKNQCISYDENFVYFGDEIHPSFQFSKNINKMILDKVKNIQSTNLLHE